MSKAIGFGVRMAKPVASLDMQEAHSRVIGLYKEFYRYIPYILKYFDIPKNECDVRWKLREYFYKNANIKDIRVIDILVIKGYMELEEVTNQWQQKGHIMAHWNPTQEYRPTDFMSKFLRGDD